jgi:hypothetical protein
MKALAQWSPDELLKALALLGASVAFLIGLIQYRRAQQWKRAEWVAQEMKHLFSAPLVPGVLQMIDWGARNIDLYPLRETPEERVVWITDDVVAGALAPHEQRPKGFTPLEADIRAAFDTWLDAVERFAAYAKAGLVSTSDLRPYLKYWADQVCRTHASDGSEDRLVALKAYMAKYGYEGALKLLERIHAT